MHSVGTPVKLLSSFSHAVGFVFHFIEVAAALLRSLDILAHDVDGVVDLLYQTPFRTCGLFDRSDGDCTYSLKSSGSVAAPIMVVIGSWNPTP